MSFTTQQIEKLKNPLEVANIKQRKQGYGTVDYVEGWYIIDQANEVFGFDGWNRETIYLKEVSRYQEIDEDQVLGNWRLGYESRVRITIGEVIKEGTGYGSGIGKDLFSALESAGKEAETDAMKRAFIMLGYRFGLALYDKERRHVNNEYAAPPEQPDISPELKKIKAAEKWANEYITELHKCKNAAEFYKLKSDTKKNEIRERIRTGYPFLSDMITEATQEVAVTLNIKKVEGFIGDSGIGTIT